jgi:hypothetical protein
MTFKKHSWMKYFVNYAVLEMYDEKDNYSTSMSFHSFKLNILDNLRKFKKKVVCPVIAFFS